MNEYVKSLLFVFLVYSVAAGLLVCVFSVLPRLFNKKKISLAFVGMRFAKGFVSVALACAFIFADMKYGLFSGPKEYTPSASAINGVLGLLKLAIPIVIVVVVHKCTKKIEDNLGI